MNCLYIVIPCHNEQEVLPETASVTRDKLFALAKQGLISSESRIMLVDDGSTDGTWSIIERLCRNDRMFSGVKLSRNRGHQNALFAGLMQARQRADAVVSMDADLQDDINAIDDMVRSWHSGADIVYGVRSARARDTAFKRSTARGFYGIMNSMGAELVYDHADFRLMTRRALDALSEYGEFRLFLRGIVPTLGFSTAVVEYERRPRMAGESKYTLKKMLSLAVDGLTSLTSYPLRCIFWAGCALVFTSFVLLVVFIIQACLGHEFFSWRVILWAITGGCGLNLTAMGILGEYIGQINQEVRRRPRYFIEKIVENQDTN